MRLGKPRWLTASAVAFLVPSLLVGLATVAIAATAPLPGDPKKGETLYNQSGCSTCHGASLTGGIGPPLAPIKKLPDTQKPLDPQYLIDTITNGKSVGGGYGAMPVKGNAPQLTDQDIKDIVAFIIQTNQTPAGQRPYSPAELAKSTIAWVTIGTLAMLALTYLLSRYNMRWIAFKSRRNL
ncbi:MAG: cytochrome c [Candidatus Dormibacteraeota bacterium]|nr:cytochrome c [Candidatus Dormibacteraeota bacterium]